MLDQLDARIDEGTTRRQMCGSVLDEYRCDAFCPSERKTFEGMQIEPCVDDNVIDALVLQMRPKRSVSAVFLGDGIPVVQASSAREPHYFNAVFDGGSSRAVGCQRHHDDPIACFSQCLREVLGVRFHAAHAGRIERGEYANAR